VKKVYLQSDAAFRMKPEDLDGWYVRTTSEKWRSSRVLTRTWTTGSPKLDATTASRPLRSWASLHPAKVSAWP